MKKDGIRTSPARPRPAPRPTPSFLRSPRVRRRRLVEGGALLVLVVGSLAFWFWLERDPTASPGSAPEGMVWIPPGEFRMGSAEFPDARPVHPVYVDGFWMDRTEVTNAQFARFAEATGYKTVAERTPRPEDFPPHLRAKLIPEKMVPSSMVFRVPEVCPPEGCADCDRRWELVPGACWRHPEGPGSDLKGREEHPAVHICWEDAVAYASWAGKRLPTEAEWERAARGGREDEPFYWGSERTPGGKWPANIWPAGRHGTAPAGSHPPNGYGLVDMSGNVWEWCSDWYRPDYYAASPRRNPQGPESSIDPHGNGEPKRVQRGGSFLCSDGFCARYRAGARGQGEPLTGQSHTGFRCASPHAEEES